MGKAQNTTSSNDKNSSSKKEQHNFSQNDRVKVIRPGHSDIDSLELSDTPRKPVLKTRNRGGREAE